MRICQTYLYGEGDSTREVVGYQEEVRNGQEDIQQAAHNYIFVEKVKDDIPLAAYHHVTPQRADSTDTSPPTSPVPQSAHTKSCSLHHPNPLS